MLAAFFYISYGSCDNLSFIALSLAVTSSRNSTRRSLSVPTVRAVSRSRSADPSRRSTGHSQMKSGNMHVKLCIHRLTYIIEYAFSYNNYIQVDIYTC